MSFNHQNSEQKSPFLLDFSIHHANFLTEGRSVSEWVLISVNEDPFFFFFGENKEIICLEKKIDVSYNLY